MTPLLFKPNQVIISLCLWGFTALIVAPTAAPLVTQVPIAQNEVQPPKSEELGSNLAQPLPSIPIVDPTLSSATTTTLTTGSESGTVDGQTQPPTLVTEAIPTSPTTTTKESTATVQKPPQASSEVSSPPVETPPSTQANLTTQTDWIKTLTDGIKALQREMEFLKTEYSRLMQQVSAKPDKDKGELSKLQQEKDKLSLENELQAEKNHQTLAQLTAEKEKLVLENEVQAARQSKLLAELQALKTRLELENTLAEQKQKKLVADLEGERSSLAAKNALLEEKNKRQTLEIQMATLKLEFEKNKLEWEKAKKGDELEELSQKLEVRDQKEQWDNQVNKPIVYTKEPYQEGHLTVSDRRIDVDMIILPGAAKSISERINYFNNKNTEYPIFLIIDFCVGGFLIEGAQILAAMQRSQAPVYVVVKSLAASMCAVITTLAKHSYAYPNAVIVHHQVMALMMGNKKQLEEGVEEANKWTKRVLQPVADKMGLSMDEFVEKMYEHNSNGDWSEFADEAVKLKWIDTVVEDMRDISYIKRPGKNQEDENEDLGIPMARLAEKVDTKGQRYVELPAPRPKDFYFLYNPDNYYR